MGVGGRTALPSVATQACLLPRSMALIRLAIWHHARRVNGVCPISKCQIAWREDAKQFGKFTPLQAGVVGSAHAHDPDRGEWAVKAADTILDGHWPDDVNTGGNQ